MANLEELAEQLVNLTVKEVSELANIFKEKYGIEPAAAAVAVAGPAAGGAAAPAAAEQTEFDVILKSAGANKLQIVSLTRVVLASSATSSRWQVLWSISSCRVMRAVTL